ncbi:Uncharacterized low-complexity proteins, partial [Streptomyces sp. MnatMP-M77]|uniref:pentapeptide repeat-containing protein n=1 Tax=unclassified Streptomyces TaxID=2593676 RepID=UPI000805BFA1
AAVGNLGEDKMDVRLGGIYALQRIMQDSRRDHPTIANVLATYIRTHTTKPPSKGQSVPADVQAAFNVLASRDTARDGTFHLDLHGAKLPGVTLTSRATDLRNADLTGAGLGNADLTGVNLSNADLSDADLSGADLSDADLTSASMGSTDLAGANLTMTNLAYANLSGALMFYTNLKDAFLDGANLSGALVEKSQLDEAFLDGDI